MVEIKGNVEINKEENYVLVSVNPKIYPLETIYAAAYIFLDRAYLFIDGDPQEEVVVEIRPKGEFPLETLGQEFNNELLNYANYVSLCRKSDELRKIILQKALLINDDDPLSIKAPWDKKEAAEDDKCREG